MNSQNSNTGIDIDILSSFNILHSSVYDGQHLFDNLVHDDCTENDWKDFLSQHENLYQIGKDGVFGGFFMVDDMGEPCGVKTCEVHAFILAGMRKFSTSFLKHFAQFIFVNTQFDAIVTTVPNHTPHVGKLLKSIGFKYMGEEQTQFKRNGSNIHMTYYCLAIDNFGGI